MMTQACTICICNYCVSHYLTNVKICRLSLLVRCALLGFVLLFDINTMGLCLVLCCLGVGKCMLEMIENKYFLKKGGDLTSS